MKGGEGRRDNEGSEPGKFEGNILAFNAQLEELELAEHHVLAGWLLLRGRRMGHRFAREAKPEMNEL